MLAKNLLGAAKAVEPAYIEDVFSTYLYTGNGSTQTINNGINLSGKGGMTWIKARNTVDSHRLFDTSRGVGNYLVTNGTFAQLNSASSVTAFNSNGFSLGSFGGTNGAFNYVSWTFRKQAKFFDVVTYTGNGLGSRSISHNLGSAPGCIIIKCTSTTSNWMVWHRSLSGQDNLYLNATDGTSTIASDPISVSGFPSSLSTTVFDVSTGTDSCNDNGATYVAYLFAHNAGGFGLTGADNVISCGSFTTSSYSATVNLGYEPQWILYKRTDSTVDGDWQIADNMRGLLATANSPFQGLQPNLSAAESSTGNIQLTSTGFVFGGAAASPYIYIAIRRGPMKVPTLGTGVFKAESYNQTSASDPAFNLGNVADMGFRRIKDLARDWILQSRLTGDQGLITNTTAAESSQPLGFWDNMVGWYQGNSITPPYSQANLYGWTFSRAPGFFDEVCYTGTGVARTVTHNLTVVPELMIVKRRSAEGAWMVNSQYLAADARLELQSTSAVKAPPEYGDAWNNTRPTSTVFTVGTDSDVNASGGTYVNYLFASCPGVSKVGTYTGTGATKQIDCGFTGGARFVLIKRTDSSGDWYVWDTARGIVAGNDSYLLLNSTAAEVTNTDYIDTYSAGFEISSTAPAAINANGGTFIFLAIA